MVDSKIRALISAVYAIVLVLGISLLVSYFWFGGIEEITGDELFHKVILALTVGIIYGFVRFGEMKRKK